jgi:hypothetical protein
VFVLALSNLLLHSDADILATCMYRPLVIDADGAFCLARTFVIGLHIVSLEYIGPFDLSFGSHTSLGRKRRRLSAFQRLERTCFSIHIRAMSNEIELRII